jgi:hypothetical protein
MSARNAGDHCEVADLEHPHPVHRNHRSHGVVGSDRLGDVLQPLQRRRMGDVLQPADATSAVFVAYGAHEHTAAASAGIIECGVHLVEP